MNTEPQNLYEVIGLSRDASQDIIEKQCKRSIDPVLPGAG